MTDEELEQQKLEEENKAAEAAKAAEDAEIARKLKEEEDKKNIPPVAPPNLNDEQIKKLEKDSGFTIKQLVTLNLLQQSSKGSSASAQMVEDYAFNSVMNELKSSGIKSSPELENKVKEKLKTIPEGSRQDKDAIKNLYFTEAGKQALGVGVKPSGQTPVTNKGKIISGVDLGRGSSDNFSKDKDMDISMLSEYDQVIFKKYKFKDMGEWKAYQSRNLDTSYEENWEPQFGSK